MIPVTQTKVVVKNLKGEMVVRGNCYAAAVASILEIPITEVPNVEVLFDLKDPDERLWQQVMSAWLNEQGYSLEHNYLYRVFHPELVREDEELGHKNYDVDEWKEKLKDNYYMVSGLSPRGNFHHVVIYQNGKLVHDPHPTRDGLVEVKYFKELVKNKPRGTSK